MPEPNDKPPPRELWFTRDMSGVYGPLATGQLQQLCRERGWRKCLSALEVRKVGAGPWKTAGKFPELLGPTPLDNSPPSAEEQRAAVEWWGQCRDKHAGRNGMIFFGIFLAILLMTAGNATADMLGASDFLIFGASSCLCALVGWIGGLAALGWLPSNCRRLLRLPAAWCAAGLIGAGGMILLCVLITLAFVGVLFHLF
jgi:hypothetical protein